MSLPETGSLNFEEFGTVQSSFIYLTHKVTKLLEKEDHYYVKLTCHKVVKDAQLPKSFFNEVQACGNTTRQLLSTLTMSPYWNWMDIRLMETLAAMSSESTNLLKRYKDYLYPQKLVHLLPLIPTVGDDDESNYRMMSVKIQTKIDNITMEKYFFYRHFLETDILDLREGACILKRIEKEPFILDWLISNDQCSHAHKSAKRNVKKFHQISLLSVHIESYEVVDEVFNYV